MIEIFESGDKGYQFLLKTEEGSVLFHSVPFYSHSEIKQTVAQLLPTSERNVIIERRTNHKGYFQFDVKNNNGELIGKSLPYLSEAGMENGIRNLKKNIGRLRDSDLV